MVIRSFITIVFLMMTTTLFGQLFYIRGYVYEANSKRPLIGANVSVKVMSIGASTDSSGYYQLEVERRALVLTVSYLGYQSKSVKVIANRNIDLDIFLEPGSEVLEEVLVQTEATDHNFSSTDLGVAKISATFLNKMPAFMGERDILKSILLLPGVSTVGEGTTGLNVRGGNQDQNLILMDGAPLFNTSHLMGFLSVFNSDVVDNFTFYKGGAPANYGGRVSSILDTKLKTPNADKPRIEGGIGLVASRLLFESNVGRKFSFYLAGRLSFPDYLFRLSKNTNVSGARANFYDLTGKADYRISEKHRLTFTAYRSNDNFRLAGDSLSAVEINASSTLFNWRSNNQVLTWNNLISQKATMRISMVQSLYRSDMSNKDQRTAYDLVSGINFRGITGDVVLTPNAKNSVGFGVSVNHITVSPGTLTPASDISPVIELHIAKDRGIESALFFSHEWMPSEKIALTYGLRYSSFLSLGGKYVYDYMPNSSRAAANIVDSTYFGRNEIVTHYGGFEPRISVRINVTRSSSLKVGYSRMYQYLQQLSNTTAALPTDRWQLSAPYIKPQFADQLSAGYFVNFADSKYEVSTEFYYKDLHNATDYRDGANLLLNEIPETGILQGKGRAYGMEVFMRKKSGILTGWISYTNSHSFLKIDGDRREDRINNGDWYAANFNKPHTLNVVAIFKSKSRVTYSANFTYSSGRPFTVPSDKYLVDGKYVPNYVGRNNEKIPDYHRLDLSATIDDKPSSTKKIRGSWVFSIYNVYGRKNAYSVFFKTKNDNIPVYAKQANAYKLSIFGTVFPSVTYNFKF